MHQHTQQLCDALDRLNRRPTWHEAARLGVELVDHDDTSTGSLHLANGDVIYPTSDGWAVIEQGRTGRLVRSGRVDRLHNPGIDPAARVHPSGNVDPTARVEAGAVIGPRAYISADAHIGKDAHIAAASFIGAGAFIGTGTTVRGACHIGNGAFIGAGSDIGSGTRINPGTQLAQGTVIDAGGTVHQPAGPNQMNSSRGINPWLVNQIANTVERLSGLNRDGQSRQVR